ncbi:MAG: hypothetical protein C4321_10295 [Chloroflexota bacterium]
MARKRAQAGERLQLETALARRDESRAEVDLFLLPLAGPGTRAEGALLVAQDASERRRIGRELLQALDLVERKEAERRRLLAQLVGAHERERRLLAADIHDELLQDLTDLILHLEYAQASASSLPPEVLEGELALALEAARSAIRRLRGLVAELWPPALERFGLEAATRALLEELEESSRLHVSFSCDLGQEPPLRTRTLAYRIVQEATRNVARHAQARRVRVSLETAGESGIAGRIEDDGRGFDPQAVGAGSLGILAMRQRAEAEGGWLEIRSRPGEGTTVSFFLTGEADPQAP